MRVIIVGSGIGGLTLGHALRLAGINDFVILERRSNPVEASGGCTGLWPHSVRILDQLGLLEQLRGLCPDMRGSLHMDEEGKVISDSNLFDMITENHGHPFMIPGRSDLIALLYNSLPDKETRVLTDKIVNGVRQNDDEVQVRCADGSVYTGDILVGCDGINSEVRRLVFDNQQPGGAPGGRGADLTFIAEYRTMFGTGPRPKGIRPCYMTETHGKGVTFQIYACEDKCYWMFHSEKEKRDPKGKRYTADEIEELAQLYSVHPVGEQGDVTFKDLWETKTHADMYEMQENIAKEWSDGRVVLLGDSAHKMTANLALGANCTIESVAVLTNHLQALVQNSSTPELDDIEAAFVAFQKKRQTKVSEAMKISGDYTRRAAWQTSVGWYMQHYLSPWPVDRFAIAWTSGHWVKGAAKLDFAPENNPKTGKLLWTDEEEEEDDA